MESIRLKLSDMTSAERNVRMHTEVQISEFVRSVEMFGQIRPIVVDENNVILAGNGLYEAMKRMGETEADVYRFTDLSENQKKKLMIADNKIFNLGIENLDVLDDFIEEMKDDLDIPGFDEEILKQMVSDAEEVTEKIAGYGTLDEKEIETIRNRNARPASEGSAPAGFMSPPEEKDTDDARFVICPNCGEKIWL